MISVKSNMLAANAARQFGINDKKNTKTVEKLSSGYRINRSADDAAGLAISEKMRRQIRGLTQASANAQDGISMVQSAEGALNEVHDMLQRANELSVKAANGTWTKEDRAMIDAELQQIKKEIDTTAKHTVFNEIRLFPDDGLMPGNPSENKTYEYILHYNLADGSFSIEDLNSNAASLGRASVDSVNLTSDGSALANAIKDNMIPDVANQIFKAFPSIKDSIGSGTLDIKITVAGIDGKNNTLAFAGANYYPTGYPFNMEIKVDVADFVAADATGSGSRAGELQSTIAHEFMHSVMQYTMTDGMTGRAGNKKFPEWFIEGTAQLTGGGFPTNWNNTLISLANKLTDENDSSQDAAIKNYLNKYTVDGRVYGHGYLAAAYAGYLANGGGAVTGGNIAAGMDRIFADILKGKTFAAALKDNTGFTEAQLKSAVNNGDADAVEFIRKLSYNSKGGAGSVITSALSDIATKIVGSTPNPTPNPNPAPNPGGFAGIDGTGKPIDLQVGADSGQHITLELYRMDTVALGLDGTDVKTQESAGDAINEIKRAIGLVSSVRSNYGAIQNRLEHTIANLDNIIENITASESLIRDTDIAKEMVTYSNRQILLQAGQSVLSQANQASNMILSLLG